MSLAGPSRLLALFILLLGGGESDHPHLLGTLPDITHWSLSHSKVNHVPLKVPKLNSN